MENLHKTLGTLAQYRSDLNARAVSKFKKNQKTNQLRLISPMQIYTTVNDKHSIITIVGYIQM